jgi:hypothetical protein
MSRDDVRDGWRGQLLRHFTPQLARLCPVTVVRDGDGLLTDSRTVDALDAAGFLVWPLDDPLALRLLYEQQCRSSSRGVDTKALVIVVPSDLGTVPFDMLHAARSASRTIEFGLGDVLPSLSRAVLCSMDRTDLDLLFDAYERHRPGTLGENATAEFVLRHRYRLAPELIISDADILKALLQLHFDGRSLPAVLATRLVALLGPRFPTWPIGSLVVSAHQFWRFLDERWPVFLEHTIGRQADISHLAIPGPALLPLAHPDVRVYIDNLFGDGRLTRSSIVPREAVPDAWMTTGVAADEGDVDVEVRFQELSFAVQRRLPPTDAAHHQWTAFARLWAEWLVARYSILASRLADMGTPPDLLHDAVEERFAEWLERQYAGLHNLSHWPRPVMVHQVGRFMAHQAALASPERRRQALVVVDGLAFSQWLLVRERVLGEKTRDHEVDESALFAWVPTLTSISRQAIFAGELPMAFGSSLLTTAKEDAWWRRFWEDRGLDRGQIALVRQKDHESDDDYFERAMEKVDHPGIYRLALVVNTVDSALHDAAAEMSWLHSLVVRWRDDGYLPRLVDRLLAHGFDLYLTSDHGNIETRGIGKLNAGDVPEISGSRVCVFPDPHTRHAHAGGAPGSREWNGAGLPPGAFALMAPSRGSFLSSGSRSLSHGGMSLEEVIVPFVSIARRA